MSRKIKEISVFFPAYNEEANIANTVIKAKNILEKIADKWEIIIVNDGSKDKTLKIAKELVKEDKRVRIVNHKVNRGYGGTLKTGYSTAKYSWVAFTDSDGQFDFLEIKKLIRKQREGNADLVLGYRIKRADSFMRKLYTFVWTRLLPRILFGLKVSDYSCGFKMIRKKVYDDVQPLIGEEKVTQIEMLVKAQKAGFKFANVGVHHYPREFGHQTGADIKVILRSVRDLIKLWWQLR